MRCLSAQMALECYAAQDESHFTCPKRVLARDPAWTVAKPVPERTTSMSSSQQLYNRVSTKLQALHPTLHLKRLRVWVWVVVGLIQGQSVQLSEIANHIPGDTQAVARVARIRRWLASKWIVSRTLYQGFAPSTAKRHLD